jgi:predicted Zn-dependent peptidase
MDNGIVVYLLEDHDLPLFDAVAYFKAGAIYDPADKLGLAGLTSAVMRTGGTDSMSGDELDEELEFMAGSVEVSAGREAAVAALSVLAKDMRRGLEIFSDVLRNPAFAEEKLDLAKKRSIEGIRRRYDTPRSTVAAEFPKLVYGEDSVWARLATEETVSDIAREDLVRFHQRCFMPNNMILGISGDFDRAELMEQLSSVFGDWSRRDLELPAIEPIEPSFVPSVNYIRKEINQSNIRLGHLGIRRHNPDQYAVAIMNYVLGWGGFTSRLWIEVRSDRGLAYSVWGGMRSGTDYGLFEAGCQTGAGTTCEATSIIRDVIAGMTEAPPTDEELKLAKDGELNSFVFNFASSAQIVRTRVDLEFYGYPPDYLDTYEEKIAAVTGEDVQRVAEKYLHPDKLVILVVGDSTGFDKPLSTFGDVTTINLPRAAEPAALQ